MNQQQRAANLFVLQCAEPACLGSGVFGDPGSDGLDHKDVGKAGDERLAAGTQLLGFDRHQAERALDPVHLR